MMTTPKARRVWRVVLLHLSFWVVHTACVNNPWKLPTLGLPDQIPWFSKISSAAAATKEPPKSRLQQVASVMRLPTVAVLHFLLAAESTARTATNLSLDPTVIITLTNLMVHCAWHMANEEQDMELRRFLQRHFILRSDDLAQGRVHPLLLSAFSHESKLHLLSNLTILSTFGPKHAQTFGTRVFSYFYVAAIYASDLFDQIIYSRFYRNEVRILFWKFPMGSLGASGAISALLTYYCLSDPLGRLEMPGWDKEDEVNLPAWMVLVIHWMWDLFPTSGTSIGHGSHLGGHAFGLCVYMGMRLWKYFVRSQRQRRRKPAFRKWRKRHFGFFTRNWNARRRRGVVSQMTMWSKRAAFVWDEWVDKTSQRITHARKIVEDEVRYQLARHEEWRARKAGNFIAASAADGENGTNATTTPSSRDGKPVDEPSQGSDGTADQQNRTTECFPTGIMVLAPRPSNWIITRIFRSREIAESQKN